MKHFDGAVKVTINNCLIIEWYDCLDERWYRQRKRLPLSKIPTELHDEVKSVAAAYHKRGSMIDPVKCLKEKYPKWSLARCLRTAMNYRNGVWEQDYSYSMVDDLGGQHGI